MSDKRTVADVLGRLAFAHELLEGASPRSKTYAAASRTVWQLQGDLAALHASGALAEVRGLGPSTLAVIGTVLAGGEPEELGELERAIPGSLLELRRIKGLGPAKIRALWKGLEVLSLADLEQACHENRLLELEGFGKKTQASVLAAIEELRAQEGTLLRDRAEEHLGRLLDALRGAGIERAVAVGGLVRGLETIDRLELLVAGDPAPAAEVLAGAGVTAGHLEGTTVVVHGASAEAFGVAELALTSSAGHLARVAAHAAERGFVLTPSALTSRGEAVAVRDADALYALCGLSPTPPERREDETPLVHAGKARALVSLGDLRGALHNHTVASDGSATLAEMREAARRAGLDYLGISEHSQSADYARGLSPERLAAQRAEIALLLARDPGGPVLLSGIESDILADGSLDYTAEELRELEVVIASGHRRFGLDRERSTARMVRAASDPMTDVVGHPTGRLLLGRPPNDFDVEAFLDACAASGCAVELNGSPHRLDLEPRWLAMAKERGVLVSIAADAHATDELSHLAHGVTIARRAGLGPEDVLNTRTLVELRSWLAARRARAGVRV